MERDAPALFETKRHRQSSENVTAQLWQAWQMEYRWRESKDQCTRDVVDVVAPSNWLTHNILISAWVCETLLDEQPETERQKILNSFQARTQE